MTKRAIIYSGLVVAALWVVTVSIRLVLPAGDYLAGRADAWLYWVAVVATILWAIPCTYILCRRRHILLQIVLWIAYALGAFVFFMAAVLGCWAMTLSAIPVGTSYHIDDRYLMRDDFYYGLVLYERQGLVEHKVGALQYGDLLHNIDQESLKVRVCKRHNLVLFEYDDLEYEEPIYEVCNPLSDELPVEAPPSVKRHKRVGQTLDGECYDYAELEAILEKCDELR